MFYDGLGREIQRYADAASGHVCVNAYYDNRGLKRRASVPHVLSGSGSFDQSNWNNWSSHASDRLGEDYTHDPLGRVTKVENADANPRSYRDTAYRGWEVTATDENRAGGRRHPEDDIGLSTLGV